MILDAMLERERKLAEKLSSFSEKEKYRRDFLQAAALYWRTEPVEPIILPDAALEDSGAFTEWFINDYRLSSGGTIAGDFYKEMSSDLSPVEKDFLLALINSYMGLYEVLEVREGEGLKVRNLFSGREMEIKDVLASGQVVIWDLLLMRIVSLEGAHRIAGKILCIPRDLKKEVLDFLRAELRKTGGEDWSAFLKENAYRIPHFLEDRPKETPRFLTEERDNLVIAVARFEIRDFEETVDRLESESDFVIDEFRPGKEAKLTWLKKGKSKEIKKKEEGEKGLVILSQLVHDTGKMKWAVLGNLTLSPGRLALECFSRERLDFGKKRLKEILGKDLVHKLDSFEDPDKRLGDAAFAEEEKPEKPDALPSGEARAGMEALLREFYENWVDQKIPVLDGLTPRQAVRTGEGREKLLELIKGLENNQERKRKEGEPWFDFGPIKKELGLDG